MIHKSHVSPQQATAQKLKTITESLLLDDTRSDAIFSAHLRLPEEVKTQLLYHGVHLSGEDGVKFGFAEEIGEFSPPAGVRVYNVLA